MNRLANALLRLGLRKGEKVEVLLFNSNHVAEILFATAKIGGVFTSINFRFNTQEVFYILDHSDARFFIYGEEFSYFVGMIRPKLTKVDTYISVGESMSSAVLVYEKILEDSSQNEPNIPRLYCPGRLTDPRPD